MRRHTSHDRPWFAGESSRYKTASGSARVTSNHTTQSSDWYIYGGNSSLKNKTHSQTPAENKF